MKKIFHAMMSGALILAAFLFLWAVADRIARGQPAPPALPLVAKINTATAGSFINIGGDAYTLGGAEIHKAGVHILGDPLRHARITASATAINVYGDNCEIAYIDFNGPALAIRNHSQHLTVHDCSATGGALIVLQDGAAHTRILDCDTLTRAQGIYILDADDTLIDGFKGRGSGDEHDIRISGGTHVTIRNSEFWGIDNKECVAPRSGDFITLVDCLFHYPVLWGQGAGDGSVANIKHSAMIGCTLDYAKAGIGGMAEIRVGAEVAVLNNTFISTNPAVPPLQIGPGSAGTLRGNVIKAPEGNLVKGADGSYKLPKPFVTVDSRGKMIGGDDTRIEKL